MSGIRNFADVDNARVAQGRAAGRRMKTLRDRLETGRTYTLMIQHRSENELGRGWVEDRRYKLVKCYEHFALFRHPVGYMESYRYWDLERMLKPGQVGR